MASDSLEDRLHYRAADRDGSTEPELPGKNDGANERQRRNLLTIDQVVHTFRAFFDGKPPPRSLSWRVIDVAPPVPVGTDCECPTPSTTLAFIRPTTASQPWVGHLPANRTPTKPP